MATADPNPTPKPVRKAEEAVEDASQGVSKAYDAVKENPTVRRLARNTVRFGLFGTALTAADEILGWGADKAKSYR